jgi:hypothetical protein
MVQNKIQEAVKKHRKLKDDDFRNNQTVLVEKFDKLKYINVKQFGVIRPDLQFWVKLREEGKRKDIWKLFIVEFAITIGRRINGDHEKSLDKMRATKTNKYSSLVNHIREEMDRASDARTEFGVEFRTFIISSLGAVPNETVKSFKSMIGKCSMSNACLWLKSAFCEVLKGSFAIWIGGKDVVYSMMRPKFAFDDLEKQDREHQRVLFG